MKDTVIKSIFTIDVEDYFHICGVKGTPPINQWDSISGRVEQNLLKLWDILAKYDVKSTCFFLGYIARRYPHLVKEAEARGHEVAAHGMYHTLIYNMSRAEFTSDLNDCKYLLEDISGKQVSGYRSPSFSHTVKTPYLYDILKENGFSYDSSLFPAKRENGGIICDNISPHWINTAQGKLLEFPISVNKVLGNNICFYGGGYLRLFPAFVMKRMARELKKQGIPILYYLHPREIDPHHPRLKMSLVRHLKSYINLKSVDYKLRDILSNNKFITCNDYFNNYSTRTKVNNG